MLDTAGDIASAALKGLSAVPATSGGDGSGLWGTVDYPVRIFLADQAAHLAVAPAALYAFWQLTGLLGLVGGFLGNSGPPPRPEGAPPPPGSPPSCGPWPASSPCAG
ncbi:hypothetical protein [Streptomyces californicus]|nr:hypothetical protein [Streptomyces californicus]